MFVNKTLILILINLCALHNLVKCSRILGIFPFAARSHNFLGSSLMKGLAEAGHNVTMISPYQQKDKSKRGSYRDIVLTGFREDYESVLESMNMFEPPEEPLLESFFSFFDMILKLNDDFFANDNVQKLLKSEEKFDVVIVEQFLLDSMKIFGHIYNAPVIAFSSVGVTSWVNNIVGNPSPLSYIPTMETEFSPYMSFTERLTNLFMYLVNELVDYFYYFPGQNEILKKYFPNPPNIYDLNHNVSLVLLNSHESLNQPVPYVPNMVQIGGFHVRPSRKLPEDLQQYLDNATDGVVYFSLGSHLRSKDLPPSKRNALLTAFSKLKENVLWKWEGDDLPGKPANVEIAKWLPQQDILAHPNVKLFVTHGGLLSTTETVYHGVPILAIPVFGDQPLNAMLATYSGFALSLPYEDPLFSEGKLSEMLHELLTNPKYRENAKKRSQIFSDRPLKPMDAAVYWVEYVIRHKGAAHLKVAGVNLPWYIYHSIDIIGFLALSVLLVMYLSFITMRKVIHCWGLCNSSRRKSKTD